MPSDSFMTTERNGVSNGPNIKLCSRTHMFGATCLFIVLRWDEPMIGSKRVGNCCVYFCLSSFVTAQELAGRTAANAAMDATDCIKSRLVCSSL